MQQSLPAILSTHRSAQPFLKWAGGKRKLVGDILRAAPPRFERYLEPFLGGGAVALSVDCPKLLLNDGNAELINTYIVVRDQLPALQTALDEHRRAHSEQHFYAVRARNPDEMHEIDRAARFIYLNKACFNGLYRVNREGKFNVPYGHAKKLTIYDRENLRAVSEILQHSELSALDYKEFLEQARAGDFVYLDPPYAPVSKFSDFKRYTKEQFRESDQYDLATVFQQLIDVGAYPILSNSHTELTLEMYSRYNIQVVHMTRNINADSKGRAPIREILVTPK